jgi:lipocalin
MTMHAIRYRRPETPWSLSRMTTQSAKEAAHQVERLKALGYEVKDITPPLNAAPEPGVVAEG